MNLLVLSVLIEIMIYLSDRPLVIMLILGLGLSILPKIDLLISSIFLLESSEKFFLILRILSMFLNDTWAYKGLPNSAALLFLSEVFFSWNFDLARTSFDGLRESWDRESFVKLASLVEEEELAFFPLIKGGTLVVNSSLMSSQKVLLLVLVLSWFQLPLKTAETKSKVTWPKPLRNGMSSFLLFFISLLLIKSEMWWREILMLLTSISYDIIWPNMEIRLVQPSHKLGLPSWYIS